MNKMSIYSQMMNMHRRRCVNPNYLFSWEMIDIGVTMDCVGGEELKLTIKHNADDGCKIKRSHKRSSDSMKPAYHRIEQQRDSLHGCKLCHKTTNVLD